MELVTIKIDLSRSEPVEIRRSEAEKVTRAYVHPAEGVAVQTKRLFRPLMLGPASGLYSLISGDRYATDDEIRLGVGELLRMLGNELRTCGDMMDRLREEWLGRLRNERNLYPRYGDAETRPYRNTHNIGRR